MFINEICSEKDFEDLLEKGAKFYLFFIVDWSVQANVAKRKLLNVLSKIKNNVDVYEINVSSQNVEYIEKWLNIDKKNLQQASELVHLYAGGEGGLLCIEDKIMLKISKRVYLMTDTEIEDFFR